MAITPEKLLEEWKKKLLDLSKRNNLLNFRSTKRGSLEIKFPEFEKLFNDILDEKTLHFAKPSNEEGFKAYSSKPSGKLGYEIRSDKEELSEEIATLRSLRRKAKTINEEQGINVLHLAFGFVHWKESENATDEYVAPLILVPVSLHIENVISSYELSIYEDDITINPTLCYKLEHDYNINLPEFESEDSIDNYLKKCEKLIREQKGWSLERSVYLSIFSYLKINMYKDLEDNADIVESNAIVKALGGNFDDLANNDIAIAEVECMDMDQDQKPESVFQVLDADSSQQEAIELAKRGASFVLQGPPGTGKSQTITNIIAECLAANKKILFVSEKEAALEVVKHRLEQTHLMDFCLSLHSHKANKKAIINELYRAATLDKKRVKEQYLLQLDKLYENRLRLNEICKELHREIAPLNKTIFEVNGEVASLESTKDCSFSFEGVESISYAQFDTTISLIDGLDKAIKAFEGNRFSSLWNNCKLPFLSNQNRNDFGAKVTKDFLKQFKDFERIPQSLIDDNYQFTWNDANNITKFLKFCSRSSIIPEEWRQDNLESKRDYAEKWKSETDKILTSRQIVENNFDNGVRNFHSREAVCYIKNLHDELSENTKLALVSCISDGFNPQVEEIKKHAEAAIKYLGSIVSIDDAHTDLHLSLGASTISRLREGSQALHIIKDGLEINHNWFSDGALAHISKALEILSNTISEYKRISDVINARFEKAIYAIDVERMLPKFRTDYASLFRFMNSSYREDIRVLRGICSTGKLTYKDALQYLNELRSFKEKEASINDMAKKYQVYFEKDVIDSEFDTLKYLDIADKFRIVSNFYHNHIPTEVQKIINRDKKQSNSVEVLIEQYDALLEAQNSIDLAWSFSADDDNQTVNGIINRANTIIEYCQTIKTLFNQYSELANSPQTNWKLLGDVDSWNQYLERISTNRASMENTFGALYNAEDTKWQEIIDAIDWLAEFKKFESQLGINNSFCKKIITDKEFIIKCSESVEIFESLKQQIEPTLTWFDSWFPESHSLRKSDIGFTKAIIDHYIANIGYLDEWLSLKRAINACREVNLDSFIDVVFNDPNIDSGEYVNIFKKRFYAIWLDKYLHETKEWSNLSKVELESLRTEFKDLDKSQMELAQLRIYQLLSEQLPNTSITTSANDQLGLLRREYNKKSRQMPLRKLFTQIPALVMKVKPCLMMSPLSVSLLLQNKDYAFDVVIFDEASQIKPENAIGSIIRGKQIIIAGDTHQLPPTSFFEKSASEEDFFDDESEDTDYAMEESILDAGANILPEKYLKWHYRSRHEHLIAFSNAKIYNGRLTTFPSAVDEIKDNGVELIYVENAIYDRGGKQNNAREAQKVSELVFDHIKNQPSRSLGIIANSESQARAIEDIIIKKRALKPEFESFFSEEKEEPFFIKSLESVQGDERDTIIFSVGYGKDATGKMYQSFGPLNKDGGERRLNVAVTRAKYNFKMVTSILSEDIVISEGTKQGPRLLKVYIDFAKRGMEAITGEIQDGNGVQFDSPFEESVYNYLTEKGYLVETQIGCAGYRIDLGIKDPDMPGRYVLGIECDGATYHSSKCARERDRLRQDVLENIGWNFYRIWSTEWVRHTDHEKMRLLDAIENAIHNKSTKLSEERITTHKKNNDDILETVDDEFGLESSDNKYGFVEYKSVDSNVYNYYTTVDRISYILEIESPMHIEYLYKRVAPHMGREKATVVVRDEVDYVLNTMIPESIEIKGEFIYWKPVQQSYKMRINSGRDITYISPEELQHALLSILRHAIGITKEALIKDTAHAIGYAQAGSKITNSLSAAFDGLTELKKIRLSPSGTVILE